MYEVFEKLNEPLESPMIYLLAIVGAITVAYWAIIYVPDFLSWAYGKFFAWLLKDK